MAKVTVAEFVDLIQKSQVVRREDLRAAIKRLRHQNDGKVPTDLDFVIQEFVSSKLLTQWQCEKLKDGKFRGFFLGKYKLLELLGSGGMSLVYLAEHTKMHRRVAIKVLPRKLVGDSSHLDRFYREAQAAAALDHPNIVRAYDIDSNESGLHYLVMEYVPGSDLKQAAKPENQPLEIEKVVHYISQAAAGLQHAHQASLVHRDVKPANLLVDHQHQVKLLDLGLALTFDDKDSLTEAHDEKVFGTVDYLAPEQAQNSHNVDFRVDVYALGCTLYYAMTGHAPFPDGTLAQRVLKHQTTDPPPLSDLRSDCPPSLSSICQRMMHKNPDDRIQSAGEVHERLVAWLAERSSRWTGKYRSTTDASATAAENSVEIAPSIPTSQVVNSSFVITESESRVARHRERGRKKRKPPSSNATQKPSAAPIGPPSAAKTRPVVSQIKTQGTANTDQQADGESIERNRGDIGIVATDDKPILATRRNRKRRGKKPPLGLWLFLTAMVLLAIGLAVLATKNGAI